MRALKLCLMSGSRRQLVRRQFVVQSWNCGTRTSEIAQLTTTHRESGMAPFERVCVGTAVVSFLGLIGATLMLIVH